MRRLATFLRHHLYRLSGATARKAKARPAGDRPLSLAVLAIMKNEAMNLDEWMSHYFAVGADRIVLIDNGSTDDTVEKARAWVDRGRVDLISRPERHRQRQHYWDAFTQCVKGRYDWLLIADLDEFWFCPDGTPIPARLAEPRFTGIDVVYANWQMFGSSGLQDHPASLRTGIVACDPRLASHQYTKYLCRTAVLKTPDTLDIHKVRGANSSRTVSDNHSFRLFHYQIQSVEFFTKVKMTRGDPYYPQLEASRTMAVFHAHDATCTAEDRTLADLVAQGRLGRG
jgi:hypothetical protein